MPLRIQIETPAAVEPVSVAELKTHLHEDGSDQDALMLNLIRSATEIAQNKTGRQFVTATFEQWFPRFASPIELLKSPLVDVEAVTYVDVDGEKQTLADTVYQELRTGILGELRLKHGQVWPAIRSHPEAVKVTYKAGYGEAPADVPESVRQWILLHAGLGFRQRELTTGAGWELKEIPSLAGLLDPVRIPRVA